MSKIIIAGSRDYNYMFKLEELIEESGFEITEVVCGMARGVDELGFRWATLHNIPIKEFPADWNQYGKKAGPIRNKAMSEYADAAIILCYDDSKGSLNMEQCMLETNKPYYMSILSRE